MNTLFPKTNTTFLKLPFFWEGVQVSALWAKCQFYKQLEP